MSTAAAPATPSALARLEPQGAAIVLADLLRWRLAAAHIPLENRRHSTAMTGSRRSALRGRGIDFDEVRLYQTGDDVRTIDWRVTARTGKAHTKIFREEKERPVMLVLDLRSTMLFGSRRCFKSVLAAHAAALLAWAALDAGDRIGAMLLGDDGIIDIKPRRSRHTVLQLLRQIHNIAEKQLQRQSSTVQGTDFPGWPQAMQQLAAVSRPGACYILISDFHDWTADAARSLHGVVRHSQCFALQVRDELELRLPPIGIVPLRNRWQRAAVDISSKLLLQRFQQQGLIAQDQLVASLQTLQVPLLVLQTGADLFPPLRQFFTGERQRGR